MKTFWGQKFPLFVSYFYCNNQYKYYWYNMKYFHKFKPQGNQFYVDLWFMDSKWQIDCSKGNFNYDYITNILGFYNVWCYFINQFMSFNINRYIILRFLWFDGKQQQCKNKKSLFLSMIETMLYYYKSYLIQQRKTSKVINMQWEVNGGKLYNKIQYILKSLRSRFMCITYSCIFFESYIHCKKTNPMSWKH